MLPNPVIFGYTFDWFQDLQYLAIILSIIILVSRRKYWKDMPLTYAFGVAIFVITLGYFGSGFMEFIEVILTGGTVKEDAILDNGGERWYGAMLFNFAGFYLLYQLTKSKPFLNFVDEITVAAAGGLVIGKIGCGLSGHGCYGIATNLPWGNRMSYGVPSFLPAHPTPLYDAAILFLLFLVLVWLSKRKKYVGQVAALFVFVSAVANILVEIIRLNESVFWKFSLAQVVYLSLLVAVLIFYGRRGSHLESS